MTRARLVAALGALVLLACEPTLTQVMIVVDTDLSVPDELDEVRIDLTGPDASLKRAIGLIESPDALPATLAVVHRGGALGPVRATVTGFLDGANVVQRRARFSFVEGEVRILRIDLTADCVGIACEGDATCADGACRPTEVDPAELTPYDPGRLTRLDASPPTDRMDGGVDAGCTPAAEACDGVDQDCDGAADEGFDLDTDPMHCGACGSACPVAPANGSSACVDGGCVLTCDDGFDDCDADPANGCEASLGAPTSCGACGTACGAETPLCADDGSGPTCVVSCTGALVECGGSCVDTDASPLHCGGCGTMCPDPPNAVPYCTAGSCRFDCDPGFADCNGDPADGCESNLRELANCGSCGVRCARANGIASCATGTCALVGCAPLFGDCDANPANGCEADLSADETRCGACGNACQVDPANASESCVAGVCELTCDPGFASCDGDPSDGCETSLASATSCGACGVACETPTPFCEALGSGGFACTDGCSGSTTFCDPNCVDTSINVLNCGGCGMVCSAGQNATPVCSDGSCGQVCSAGFESCMGNPRNCETRVIDDPLNCGGCGTICPDRPSATPRCADFTCGFACDPTHGDCNGVAGDGCEVDLRDSVMHCGGCGDACGSPPGASDVRCRDGACEVDACSGSLADCDGTFGNGCEVDTDTDKRNCGGCGMDCGGGQRCCSGRCRPNSQGC